MHYNDISGLDAVELLALLAEERELRSVVLVVARIACIGVKLPDGHYQVPLGVGVA